MYLNIPEVKVAYYKSYSSNKRIRSDLMSFTSIYKIIQNFVNSANFEKVARTGSPLIWDRRASFVIQHLNFMWQSKIICVIFKVWVWIITICVRLRQCFVWAKDFLHIQNQYGGSIEILLGWLLVGYSR